MKPHISLNIATDPKINNGRTKQLRKINGAKDENNNTIFGPATGIHLNPCDYDQLQQLAKLIQNLVGFKENPSIGVICGSGLGLLADKLIKRKVLPYKNIPGFPFTHVAGHKGNLVFGYLKDKFVVCMQGRIHPYEYNMDLVLCTVPIRIMKFLGVKTLIVSNAAGSLNSTFEIGDLMLIKDQIFMPGICGFSPLRGVDPQFGPQFISMHNAYDRELRKIVSKVAESKGINLRQGVYAMTGGTQYESPAECRLLKHGGADVVGMSTCHEVIGSNVK